MVDKVAEALSIIDGVLVRTGDRRVHHDPEADGLLRVVAEVAMERWTDVRASVCRALLGFGLYVYCETPKAPLVAATLLTFVVEVGEPTPEQPGTKATAKIDLSELECKAREATQGEWRWLEQGGRVWLGVKDTHAPVMRVGDGITGPNTVFILHGDMVHTESNSPPVTLALIARIRELEDGLFRCGDPVGKPPTRAELLALLGKGAVLQQP